MNSLDIEIAIANHINWRRNLVVPNVWWGLGFSYELDLAVLTKARCLWEVEIKISKADLKADLKKRHQHDSQRVSRLYFAIPEKLETCINLIPERAGILSVIEKDAWTGLPSVKEIKKPKINRKAKKLTDKEVLKLHHLAAMRIWPLKQKLKKERIKT